MTDQGKKYLSDILRAIDFVEKFTSDITDYDHYTKDLKTQSAVERQLGIIGKLKSSSKNSFPDRLWKMPEK